MSKLSFFESDTGYAGQHVCAIAAAIVGSAVVGGAVSASASRRGASTQAEAARDASAAQADATARTNAMQMEMYRQNMATNAPYLQSGQVAQAALMSGLGLGQLRATQGVPGDEFGEGGITNYGATQAELNQGAGALQPGQLNRPFAPSDLTTDPSYQWRLAQGQRTLEASAAARGGLLTGQGAADIMNYGQGMASTEYQAAFDRNRTTQNDLYNRLAALGNVGQIATGAAGGYGATAASQFGANTLQGQANQNAFLIGGANAQAAGAVGSANAWGNALQGGLSNWTTLQGQRQQPMYVPPGNYGGTQAPAPVETRFTG